MKKIEKKRKKELRNGFNYVGRKEDIEWPKGESETVQGDTLSLAEMLNRLSMGMPLTKKNGIFLDDFGDEDTLHDSHDMEKLINEDIAVRTELYDEASETLERYEELKKKSKEKEPEKEVKEPEKKANEEEVKIVNNKE